MASGCIMGECPKCGEFVWEDEWDLDKYDRIVHAHQCVANYHTVAENNRLRNEVDYWRDRALKSERELHKKYDQLSLF